MRKILFLLTLLPCILFGQDIYSDMLAAGKTWNFIRWPYGNTHEECMDGDTIVDGKECRRYGRRRDDGTFYCMAAFRQEGDRIYVNYPGSEGLSLAYDFGVSEGDVLAIADARIEVTSTDAVTARGHVLRRVSFKVVEYRDGTEWRPVDDSGQYTDSWIEGIGGSTGPISLMPVPGLAGNYDMLMDVGLGGELLCDESIFYGEGHEKLMLTYRPEWTYDKQVWDVARGGWGDPVECHAVKTGMQLPPPMNFPYTTIRVVEEQERTLLLRNGTMGQVLAEKASYMDYVSKAIPGIGEVFAEAAEYPLDVVLYDFTLGVGDRYPCRGDVTVVEVSEMTTRDGVGRKTMRLSNGLLLAEGIGCLNSRYGVFGYQNDPGVSAASQSSQTQQAVEPYVGSTVLSFLKYGEKTTPVYVKEDWQTGIGHICNEPSADGSIYDLMGRRIAMPPSRGIYISDGRKLYVK